VNIDLNLDLKSEKFEYESPKAKDVDGDDILMDFKGIESYTFIKATKTNFDTFKISIALN